MSYRRYPSAGSNPSVSLNGQPIPLSSTLAAGSDGTNLRPLKTDAGGELQVDVLSSALPSGAATEAKQDAGNASLVSIDSSASASAASLASIDGKLSDPMPIDGGNPNAVIVDGSAVTQPISAASLPLPAGASTEAKQDAGNASLASIDGKLSNPMPISAASLPLPAGAATSAAQTDGTQRTKLTDGTNNVGVKQNSTQLVGADYALITNTIIHAYTSAGGGSYVDVKANPSGALVVDASGSSVSVSNFPATQPVSGSVSVSNFPATQPVSGSVSVSNFPATQPVSAASLPLPTNAATETTLAAMSAKLPAAPGQLTRANSLSVTMASDQPAFASYLFYLKGEFVRNDYSSTAVTTAAYTQLIASTAAIYTAVEIFDSSGQTLKLAIGGAGSEVDQFLIFPGGNGRIPIRIAASSRISIRAVSGTASVGEICINFYV